MSLVVGVGKYHFFRLIDNWLSVYEIAKFDESICNHNQRKTFKFYLRLTDKPPVSSLSQIIKSNANDFRCWCENRNIQVQVTTLIYKTNEVQLDKRTSSAALTASHWSLKDLSALYDFVSSCSCLREIHVTHSEHPTDFLILCIQLIEAAGSKLKVCNFTGLTSITNKSIIALAKHCPQLTDVDLTGCSTVNEDGVSKLLSGCKLLVTVGLPDSGCVTDSSIMYLARECPLLTALKLSKPDTVTAIAMRTLTEKCSLLTAIEIRFCRQALRLPAFVGIALNCGQRLTRLHVANNYENMSSSLCTLLTQCPNLTELSALQLYKKQSTDDRERLCFSNDVVDTIYTDLRHINRVELRDDVSATTNAAMLLLTRFSSLVAIDVVKGYIEGCPWSSHEQPDPLTQFSLTATELNSKIQSVLWRCAGLLRFTANNSVTVATMLAVVRSSPVLTVLNIQQMRGVSDTVLQEVAVKCSALVELRIANTAAVTSIALAAVAANNKSFTRLDCRGCANIATDFHCFAEQCPQLRHLDVTTCNFTNQALLDTVFACRTLTALNLHDNSQITKLSIEAVRQCCPQLRFFVHKHRRNNYEDKGYFG